MHEEQTQLPQEQMQLRTPIRESIKEISDDFVVFLQEHENEINMMKDDPINFDSQK